MEGLLISFRDQRCGIRAAVVHHDEFDGTWILCLQYFTESLVSMRCCSLNAHMRMDTLRGPVAAFGT